MRRRKKKIENGKQSEIKKRMGQKIRNRKTKSLENAEKDNE